MSEPRQRHGSQAGAASSKTKAQSVTPQKALAAAVTKKLAAAKLQQAKQRKVAADNKRRGVETAAATGTPIRNGSAGARKTAVQPAKQLFVSRWGRRRKKKSYS
jgi:surface antigen